jgi:hypothetical protein
MSSTVNGSDVGAPSSSVDGGGRRPRARAADGAPAPACERAHDLRTVFADAADDVEATSRQAQIAAQRALDAMTGDPEWRALYMEFLAHAARDAAFRRAFARRTDQMRGALEEVVVQRTRPIADALGMEPEQLAVVIDALGTGLWANHMLHGARAVPPDLFSKALALLVEGIAARAAVEEGTA